MTKVTDYINYRSHYNLIDLNILNPYLSISFYLIKLNPRYLGISEIIQQILY